MDKLAFVKTVEAVLAAVIAFNAYNFLQMTAASQARTIERNPSKEIRDFMDIIGLESIVNDYDYLKLDSLFSYLFFNSIYYYFEPVYYDKFIINKTDANISFAYNFPTGIDENSVRVIGNNRELKTNALFHWYKVPIKFNSSLTNDYVEINATLDKGNINNKSLMFFINGKKSVLSLVRWNQSQDSANVTIIAYVPKATPSDKCFIYFSTDNYTNITYPSLSATRQVNSTFFNTVKAETADVLFSPIENTSSYYLRYSLFTSSSNNYDNVININNSGLHVSVNTSLKGGTHPRQATIKGKSFVRKIVPRQNGFVELRVYGGYS